FVPFAGKFSQILRVLAAHGNVKGELLSKILVEATILAEQAKLFVDFVSTYYVREAFNHDKDNITLKAMPGLTASHLDPNGFEKMRVSLAFQLFGDRVLRGLHHYKDIIESSYGKGALDGTELFFRQVAEERGDATAKEKVHLPILACHFKEDTRTLFHILGVTTSSKQRTESYAFAVEAYILRVVASVCTGLRKD
ncbi:hypothetical protein HPB47_009616, partial [Ixodes persulcatus]